MVQFSSYVEEPQCGGDTQHPVAGLADDYSVGEIVAASLEIFSKGHRALFASLSVVESGYFDIVKTSLFVHSRVVERAETDEAVVQSAGMVFISVYELSEYVRRNRSRQVSSGGACRSAPRG